MDRDNSSMRKVSAPKTYFVQELGNDTDKENKTLWIICHGYGQLAEFFSKKFKSLDLEKNHLVFPEAGNHYYLSGFTGRVGANWMTKHHRKQEIEDINNYLSAVYKEFNPIGYRQFVLLGFSQGAYSVVRWMMDKEISCDAMVLWGAQLAEDYFIRYLERQKNQKLFLVLGDEDDFIPVENAEQVLRYYDKNSLDYTKIAYHGGHDIMDDPLRELQRAILDLR